VLFTWQKLAPLYLLLFQFKISFVLFILCSGVLGGISIFNKRSLKEIMAFSSIFNLSWLIVSLALSFKLFLIFAGFY
jgi:NADH:ubiquinone oxidoreductase subunit 2 (subunit N)